MRVFLSYSRADGELADRLRMQLERHGIGVWSDRPISGESLTEKIDAAVRAVDAILVLVGPQDGNDDAQRFTWSAALQASWEDESKLLIPILVEPAKLPPFLRSRQAISLQPATDLDRIAGEIAETLLHHSEGVRALEPISAAQPVAQDAELEERRARLSELTQYAEALRQ